MVSIVIHGSSLAVDVIVVPVVLGLYRHPTVVICILNPEICAAML